MTIFNAKFFARLSILSLPLVLMGAHGNCDVIGTDGCEEIALQCEDGEEPADTDGDGCEDSCVPIANCLAFPVCEEGETEVSGPSECLQDDAVCYENSMCGTTIWCTGPDDGTSTCYDDSECGSNEFCSFEDDCGVTDRPDGSSEEDALVACLGTCVEVVDCPAIAIECEEGEFAIDSDGDGCVDSCEPISNCEAYPVCDEGHTEVSDSSGCLQDDAVCYERSMCGYTIWCTGPDGNIDG